MSDTLIAAVRKGWTDSASVAAGSRVWRAVRVAVPGPVIVLAGVKETDCAHAVLFETSIDQAPAVHGRFEADGIAIHEERNFGDRTYRISVTLERADLENIFCILVSDLIEAASRQPTPPAAIAAVFARSSAWQAFLRARRSGLSREAVIGLIGELLFARHLSAVAGHAVAIDAWAGPAGGLHDFLRNGYGVEVKTTSGVASQIDVTSLDQLEDHGLSALLLAHVRLVEAPGGLTLPSLVTEFREELVRRAPGTVRSFGDALLAAGYADIDADLYAPFGFQPLDVTFYKVDKGFPRLTRSTVPQGIIDARYKLDLRSIQPYLADDKTMTGLLRQMGDRHG